MAARHVAAQLPTAQSDKPLPRKYLSYHEDNNSSLHSACYFGDYKLALMHLLSTTDPVNTEVRNVWEETPLHHCTSQGHLEIMMLLLDGGADVNALDKDYYTPLHHAVIHGNKDATELLLCYGAKIFNDPLLVSGLEGTAMPKSPVELATHVHVCHDIVEKAQGRVWSLQHYCRISIRRYLGVGRRKRIKELPLPRSLIAYLTTLPLDCSARLHDTWDRVRLNAPHKSRQSNKPSTSRDGTMFNNSASLQALKSLQIRKD